MFGSVKTTDGPVAVILDLRPIENGYVIENMQKATSAYAKNEDPKTGETAVEFLEKSEVMFLNEKRTARLLRSMGLLTPIELNQSGSIGSIEYIGRKVKLNGVPFKQVVLSVKTYVTL